MMENSFVYPGQFLLFFYNNECPYCGEIWPQAQQLCQEKDWTLKGIECSIMDETGVPQVPGIFASALPTHLILGRDCIPKLRELLNER